jgi:hypothetical protein
MEMVLDTRRAAARVGLAPQTLNKLRCIGGGPPYYKHDRRVVYSAQHLDEWLQSRLRTSTSDSGAQPRK